MNNIKTLISKFDTEFKYHKDEFKHEYIILKLNKQNLSLPKKAAYMTASIKRYKTSRMLNYILYIASQNNIDLTPTVVRKLNKELFNRVGSQKLIVDIFGITGRINKSKDKDNIDAIVKKFKSQATEYMITIEQDILDVKKEADTLFLKEYGNC